MSKTNKIILIAVSLLMMAALAFGLAAPAKAVEFDQDGFIGEDEVIDDDLFLAGETVEIFGTVNGDVFAAGSIVKVNGTITGSLFTGAQSIRINGDIEGSVYAGSSTFSLGSDGEIGRNLYYGGFNLSTDNNSLIGKDLLVGAYQALLSGTVGRNVRAGVGALELDGAVAGDVYAVVESPSDQDQPLFGGPPGVERIVPSGIRVAEDAEIGGKLTYESAVEQADAIQAEPGEGVVFEFNPDRIPEGAAVEEAGRDIARASRAAVVGSWVLQRVRTFFTLLLLGGLAVWQLPGLFTQVSEQVEKKTMASLGWGMVTLIVVYLGAFLIAGLIIAAALFFGVITLGGLSRTILAVGFSSLGLSLASFGLLMRYVSKLVVSLIAGKLILNWVAPKYKDQMIWPLILGILIYTLLRAIPFLGWFIGALVTFIGLGAMWLTYQNRNRPAQVAEPDVEPVSVE